MVAVSLLTPITFSVKGAQTFENVINCKLNSLWCCVKLNNKLDVSCKVKGFWSRAQDHSRFTWLHDGVNGEATNGEEE